MPLNVPEGTVDDFYFLGPVFVPFDPSLGTCDRNCWQQPTSTATDADQTRPVDPTGQACLAGRTGSTTANDWAALGLPGRPPAAAAAAAVASL
jgi:hypothetical protein